MVVCDRFCVYDCFNVCVIRCGRKQLNVITSCCHEDDDKNVFFFLKS